MYLILSINATDDECRCECRTLNDSGSSKNNMWNPSACDYECNEACKVDESWLIGIKNVKMNLLNTTFTLLND